MVREPAIDRLTFENSKEFAKGLDDRDPLKHFRDLFFVPTVDGKEQLYFLGNSLGLQPKNTSGELNKILQQWHNHGVEGFFEGAEPWLNYHDRLTTALSKIVGALPAEIAVMNQLTVNLHLLLVSFYKPKGKRTKILCEAKAFPSDQYAFETHTRHHGLNPDEIIIEVSPREGERVLRLDDIEEAIKKHGEELALVLFSGVNYYTGQVFDINQITKAAQQVGAIAGFDLAHAAGNIRLSLHDWNVDFACWCSYKYLNSGPGAVGGVYIHERFHNDQTIDRFGGWWGTDKATRFKMEKEFSPFPSAQGWQLSTPSMLLYASHKAALDIFEMAGWENVQLKKTIFNDYLWFILDGISASTKTIEFITPGPDSNSSEYSRGCQVSMLIPEKGKLIFDALKKQGVMADWREPDVIRIAPVPLYNTFTEVWQFGNIIRSILDQ